MAAKTTVKVATLTAAAKDDNLTITSLSGPIGVLDNDPGAAKVYSVFTNAGTLVNGYTAASAVPKFLTATTAHGGTVTINTLTGAVNYTAPTSGPYAVTAAQLAAASGGQVMLTDSFAYVAQMADGAMSLANVTFKLVGTNDNVTVTSGAQAGAVVEDAPDTASLTDSLSATGTIVFSDIDLADAHTVSVAAAAGNTTALGTMVMGAVSETATTVSGSAGWTYNLNNGAAQYLAEGQSVTETYVVTVSDGHGSTATQNVVITITGTEDAVMITSAAQTGTVVEDTTATATGAVAFTDVDLADGHSVSAAAAANATALGTFSLGTSTEGAGDAGGSIGWTYAIDNAAAQYLGAGESVTETYVVTVDDGHGSTATQDVVITITGTNDDVVITSGAQSGAVVEDDDTSDGGTIDFTDADVSDAHTASFVAGANATALGTFGVGTPGGGSVGWTYDLDHDASQYLADGESVTETFTVSVDDGHGSTTDQEVSVTITGTNDDVVITSGPQGGDVEEDGELDAAGAVDFSDVDLTDSHTASAAADAGNTTALGTFALGDPGSGSVGWTYELDNGAAQYLGDGETASETYTVTVDDGHGGSATQDVVITITGTNDDVVITSGAQSGAVVEDGDTSDGGTIAFTDVDTSDSHSASFVAGANATALGTFALGTPAGGSVGWTYDLDHDASQYLAAGQVASESFTVTVDDGNGSTDDQEVTVTITGSNDIVEITSGPQAGEVVEDANSPATGAVDFTDVDLTDAHTVSAAAAAGNSTSLGTFALGGSSEGAEDAGGSVGWTYTLNNAAAQYLGEGVSVTETYTVTVDDGHGSSTTQDVVITITGTNDGATITGNATGDVYEDGVETDSGDLNVSDADAGQSVFQAPGSLAGLYGAFLFDETTGQWSYDLDNTNTTVQGLNTGQTLHDVLNVLSSDGSANRNIDITIHGLNDAPAEPEFLANNGHFVSGHYMVNGFTSHDVLYYVGGLNPAPAVGNWSVTDFHSDDFAADGVMDTVVTFTQQGNGKHVDAVLIGYTGFSAAQLALLV